MRVAVATALAAATQTTALHKAKFFNQLSHLHKIANWNATFEEDPCNENEVCEDLISEQELVKDMEKFDYYKDMIENAGKETENPRIMLRNAYNSESRDIIAPCPDLLTSFDKFTDLVTLVPVWNVGVIQYGGAYSKNEIKGMRYNQQTYAACTGMANKVGSVCKLECENGGEIVGQRFAVQDRRIYRIADPEHGKDHDPTKDHGWTSFTCTCAKNGDSGEQFCWWAPVSPVWMNPRTCSVEDRMSRRYERSRLRSRWIDRATGEPEVYGEKKVTDMWDETMAEKEAYMQSGQISVLTDDDGYRSGILENDEEYIPDGGFPNEAELIEFLNNDPVYLQLVNDISYAVDHLDTKDDRVMLDMMKKTLHMFKLIGFSLINTDGGMSHLPSKFFNYGCWCSQHTRNLFHQGHGKPMDRLDQTCFRNKNCRRCAEMDHGTDCHSHKGYSFRAELQNGEPTLTCLDEFTGSQMSGCRQNMCQCDIEMIQNLVDNRDTYNINFSTGLSGLFNTEQCPENDCQNQVGGCHQSDICCGEYPSRHPQFSNNGVNQCCGNHGRFYNTEDQQCCNGAPKPMGTCNNL